MCNAVNVPLQTVILLGVPTTSGQEHLVLFQGVVIEDHALFVLALRFGLLSGLRHAFGT
jgi:hypothetical protein